ncbi:unnamed protein product [Lepeophtheirus salmonis]|uniref:(salmon louse) hypothetical protein n=1 Tax=Lepeophtheirus salmonis TaxID=72036 RepID=A0A7R8CK15_LEPSM|nr:unnamed protein product [Lepeophtheirus salmonis]CAF2816759.1 unnamed protein product [Lepeophtheirus salmonis]
MRELRLEFIDDSLKFIFSKVGIIVGKHPGYFVIIPLLLTALAATGFQRLHFQSDPEYLFSPSDVILNQDNGSILRMKIWEEIESLNFLIENFEVFSLKECDEVKSSMKLNFKDLCASHQGVILRNDSTIKSVTAVSLFYFLNSQTSKDIERGAKWERNIWVKSKPLLGLFGVISAIMATLFSFGFIIYCGVPFIGINLAAPFLMLGIGIDDTFVMLGSWRRTSVHETVPARLAQTYRDAAISITITM